jgi:hypothetical protein
MVLQACPVLCIRVINTKRSGFLPWSLPFSTLISGPICSVKTATYFRMSCSTSPFLSLPGELRNRIYNLVLAAPLALLHREPKDSERAFLIDSTIASTSETDQKIEFNQLKYVSKQLYDETSDLELGLIDIIVCATSSERRAADQLVRWISNFSTTKQSWIRTITVAYELPTETNLLVPGITESAESLVKISKLSLPHQNMRINFILPHWEYYASNASNTDPVIRFFLTGMYYAMAFRGIDLSTVLLDNLTEPQQQWWTKASENASRWRGDVELGDLHNAGLRFFPSRVEGLLDVAAESPFQETTSWLGETREWTGKHYAKQWAEVGI